MSAFKTFAAATLVLAFAACHGPATLDHPRAIETQPHAVRERPQAAPFVNARAIILLRHADIDVDKKRTMGDAVPLLERGQARAKELAYALKDAGITRIITSQAQRTKQTAAVIAQQLAITPESPFQHGAFMRGDASKPENSLVFEYLAENLKPTDVALVVHHHSVLPGLLAKFGFAAEPHYDDATEFDRLYVVLPDPQHGTYRLLRLRYGGDWHQK